MARNGIKVKITGHEQLFKQFKRMQSLTRKKVLFSACVAGAIPIHAAATIKVKKVTGNLSRSLHIEIIEESADYCELGIGTDVDYGARIEFGFMDTDSLGRKYNQSAQPYLRPALKDEQQHAIDEIEKALVEQLNALLHGF